MVMSEHKAMPYEWHGIQRRHKPFSYKENDPEFFKNSGFRALTAHPHPVCIKQRVMDQAGRAHFAQYLNFNLKTLGCQ